VPGHHSLPLWGGVVIGLTYSLHQTNDETERRAYEVASSVQYLFEKFLAALKATAGLLQKSPPFES
jgi:hypothetical protein